MKPVLLCILDGFGIGDDKNKSNAIAQANMPNYQRILRTHPHSQLKTSGLDVGLPAGQIGNSEVGHMTIGAGRVIYQDLPKINQAIKDNSLSTNPNLLNFISRLKSTSQTCHIAGLFSDGGVHSHIDHIIFLANFLSAHQVPVCIHAFLDGRDVSQKSALEYFRLAQKKLQQQVQFATVSGRYYAMDRDKKWDRIELATDAILHGKAPRFSDVQAAIDHAYSANITDEFFRPCVIGNFKAVENGDGLIFANFRADRARQISQKLFESKKFSEALALTEYSEELNNFYKILFPQKIIDNSLPQILEKNNLRQLRIAETEKYAHVTFFFSCGKEQEFRGERRVLIQSPLVATYDLQPEMSCNEVTSRLVSAIKSDEFDFIVVNYANPDMVGHSGLIEPSIKACGAIDQQLGQLEKIILEKNALMFITADHGNIECMLDENSQPHTSHTTNPVPFILISGNSQQYSLENGRLSDIAPSILNLMQLEIPKEMDGKNLIKKIAKNQNVEKRFS